MLKYVVLGALLLAASARAQAPTPYKLVVAFDRGGMTVVDYPNAARCERAKLAIDADFQQRMQKSRDTYGSNVTGSPFHFEAVCVPG